MNNELSVAKENGELYKPQQSLQVTESSRVLAETQAAMTIAQARPRDQRAAINRIQNSCQRPRLAENSAYEYSKGGAAISGATIRLLETVAQCWGNIQWGFREMSQANGESTVQAFAIDLESNTKVTRDFVVPHKMRAGRSEKRLTDPREIYEYVANQAQRRVRTCLENIIPRDVIEDALDECQKSLAVRVELTPARIKSMLDQFKTIGVERGQIEAYLQRTIDSVTPAQFLKLGRIWTSIGEKMSEPKDWFTFEEEAKPTIANKIQQKAKGASDANN